MSDGQVGDYRILRVLGEGAMGTVFLAEHALIKQRVAIKALKPELFSDDEAQKRFLREAEARARLDHPHIIRLLNFHGAERNCFMVMEYAEGQTLEDMLRERVLTPEEVTPWFGQVLHALAYAHEHNVLHRDLKPPNIMITKEGSAKLLDFGTAKFTDGAPITQEGMTIGTLHYMSREQLLGKELDRRTDLYSLAVTLYEVTTGRFPFMDEEPRKMAIKIIKEQPVKPSEHNPSLSAAFEAVVLKGLEKDVTKRFQSAKEFAEALARV